MYTKESVFYSHAIFAIVMLGSCEASNPRVASGSSYLRGDSCTKVALDINDLVRNENGTITNAVDAAYMKRIAQAGPRLLRIDVHEDMLLSGVLEQMAGVFNTSERARFTLAIGEGVAPPIAGQGLELSRSSCVGRLGGCRDQEGWVSRYIADFDRVVTKFICQGLHVVNVETFPRPNAPGLEPSGVPRIHADWFVELLRQVFAKHDVNNQPSLPTENCDLSTFMNCPTGCAADACDSQCTCTEDCAWKKQWSQIQFVSGPLDGSSSEDLRTYIRDDIAPLLGGQAFPADKIGIDVRDMGLTAGGFELSAIEEAIDTVANSFASFGSLRDIDVLFGWTGQSDGDLANRIEAVLTGDNADGDGTRDGGLKDDERINQVYFSFLHSTQEASGDQQDGVFIGIAPGEYELRAEVGKRLQEEACLNAIDYVLAVDTTGDMADDIEYAKIRASEIFDKMVREPLLDPRIALIEYRDFAIPPLGDFDDYPCRVGLDFADNKESFIQAITSIEVDGGADQRESIYSGLMTALHYPDHAGILNRSDVPGRQICLAQALGQYRQGSARAVILLGSAPPHDPEPYTEYTVDDVLMATRCPFDESTPSIDPSVCALDAPTPPAGSGSAARIFPIQVDACTSSGICPVPIAAFQRLGDETGGRLILGSTVSNLVDLIGEVFDDVIESVAVASDPPNQPPVTGGALPSLQTLRRHARNQEFVEVTIEGVSDPDGQPVTVLITGITQDEPVSSPGRDRSPDAYGLAGSRALLRAERLGNGNGRVYRINFIARDKGGAAAPGSVEVCVPHDQGRPSCLDDGQDYDSLFP